MVVAQSIKNNEGTWQYNNHDGLGWQDLSDQTLFVPDIRVRKITVSDQSSAAAKITYDLSGNAEMNKRDTGKDAYQLRVEETLKTNESFDRHISRLYLDAASTDALYIVLLG